MAQKRIGRYAVLEEIASGAQGTVYRAHDPESGRVVALKVLHPELSRDAQYVQRFRREATLAASIDHPNIVRIFDVGEAGGLHYMAVEFLPESLARIIEAGPLPVRAAAEYGAQIAEGLAAAHAADVIHRDIKPQNVLIGADGEAKITDFGIARGESLTTMTATGVMMGTPHYMAPELVQGERATEQADIYALGCVLYQMLAGEVPFTGTTPMVVLNRHVNEQPEPIQERRGDVPGALAAVVARAMEKDPARRFRSAGEMAAATRAAVPSIQPAPEPPAPREAVPRPRPPLAPPPSAPSPPPPEPARRGWWRSRGAMGAFALLLVVVIAVVASVVLRGGGGAKAGPEGSGEMVAAPSATPTPTQSGPAAAPMPTLAPAATPTTSSMLTPAKVPTAPPIPPAAPTRVPTPAHPGEDEALDPYADPDGLTTGYALASTCEEAYHDINGASRTLLEGQIAGASVTDAQREGIAKGKFLDAVTAVEQALGHLRTHFGIAERPSSTWATDESLPATWGTAPDNRAEDRRWYFSPQTLDRIVSAYEVGVRGCQEVMNAASSLRKVPERSGVELTSSQRSAYASSIVAGVVAADAALGEILLLTGDPVDPAALTAEPTPAPVLTATPTARPTASPSPTPTPTSTPTQWTGATFTLESSEAEVSLAQGTADRIDTLVNDQGNYRWLYGSSFVEFSLSTRLVVGWDNTDGELHLLPIEPAGGFTIGSAFEQVLAAQGNPDRMDISLLTTKWFYGPSSVEFGYHRGSDAGIAAIGWDNTDGELRLIPREPAGGFTIGSTYEEVLAAQGNPDRVDTLWLDPKWFYGLSFVQFKMFQGTVMGWDNAGGNLRLAP